MESAVLIPLCIPLAVIIRVLAGIADADRIRDYIESQRGGTLLEKHWTPFGPGWFGEANARIYEIRYLDADGAEHLASCKTSLFSGVYLTEDRIIRHRGSTRDPGARGAAELRDPADRRARELEAENQRLREEIRRIQSGR